MPGALVRYGWFLNCSFFTSSKTLQNVPRRPLSPVSLRHAEREPEGDRLASVQEREVL